MNKDLYRGIRVTRQGTNILKDEKGDLITDSHSIMARWRSHFFSY
jgi:hypothetical protein